MIGIRRPNHLLAAFAGAALLLAAQAPWSGAQAIETKAREAFLLDFETGTVLLNKNADIPMPPASMSKIMTAYMVFTALKEGRLSLDDKLPVSEKAWRKGGSKMFVEVGNQVRVEDLLRGVIVQSGNDACIVLAEGLAGTEAAFAEEMTRKARTMGMEDSIFANATGWPDPNHRMSARDLATLAMRTIKDFPEFYHFYGETEFTWNDIRQGNRNPLLYKSLGADGLKTGHTEEAGYGLTASAEQGDRRIVLVITGLDSVKDRSEESERLIAWAFREFENYQLFEAGEAVEQAEVWQGEQATVPLVFPEGLKVTLARKARRDMTVKVRYSGPVAAPIEQGQEIGELVIETGEGDPHVYPLVAGQAVPQLGPVGRVVAGVKHMVLSTIGLTGSEPEAEAPSGEAPEAATGQN